jgi:hypothetical protein
VEVNLLDWWGCEHLLECTLLRLLQGHRRLVDTPGLPSQLANIQVPLFRGVKKLTLGRGKVSDLR